MLRPVAGFRLLILALCAFNFSISTLASHAHATDWYVNDTSAVGVDTDNITFIGKDSNAAVIDPPGAVVLKITHLLLDSHTQKVENEGLEKVRGVIGL